MRRSGMAPIVVRGWPEYLRGIDHESDSSTAQGDSPPVSTLVSSRASWRSAFCMPSGRRGCSRAWRMDEGHRQSGLRGDPTRLAIDHQGIGRRGLRKNDRNELTPKQACSRTRVKGDQRTVNSRDPTWAMPVSAATGMGATTAPGWNGRFSRVRSSGGSLPPASSDSRHPVQPPAPPSCGWDVQELPIESRSDASLQVASVSSDRRARED